MAQEIVDLLEAVQVEIEQGQAAPGARRDGQGLDQAVLEQAAVGQAGQRVVVRQMLDAVAQFLGAGEQAAWCGGSRARAGTSGCQRW